MDVCARCGDWHVLDNLHLKPLYITPLKSANSLVTVGIRFNSLPSTFRKLLDFATKYLRKTVHSGVEIYSFVPIVWHVIAIGKNSFFIKYYNSPFRLIAFPFVDSRNLLPSENLFTLSSSTQTTTTEEEVLMRVNQLKHQIHQHGEHSKSLVINSKNILVLTNIHTEFNNITYTYYSIILFLFFRSSPFGHFIPNFGYAPPQRLKINYIFRKMMYYSCLVLVVLLSHHSLGLVYYFSSFFFFLLLYLEFLCRYQLFIFACCL